MKKYKAMLKSIRKVVQNSSKVKTKPSKSKNAPVTVMPASKSKSKPVPVQLLELPLEILGKVLREYLPQESQLQIRQVHSIFQCLYDDYIGFKIFLDQTVSDEKLSFISEISIRKATLTDITDPVPVPTSEDDENENANESRILRFHDIFLYPQYLQELVVKGNISATFLTDAVRSCKMLRNLELLPGSEITATPNPNPQDQDEAPRQDVLPEVDTFTDAPSEKFYLPNCRVLKLLLNNRSPQDTNCEGVMSIMKSLCSSSLERAVLQGWISERYSVSLITLAAAEFLLRNPTIEAFFLGIIFEHLLKDDEPLSKEDLELRPKILQALRKAGRQMDIKKFGISTRSQDMLLWKDLLKFQSNLVHISFTVDLVDGVFSSEMFRGCKNTLSQFILRGNFMGSFDFEWLADCENLKEICLHNLGNGEQNEEQQQNNSVHVINGASIPSGLESLVLFQTVGRTDEVITAIKKLKFLHTLVLFRTGNVAGETGINLECLKLIFETRTLQSTLLVRFVAPNPVEASELARILKIMNEGMESRNLVMGQPEVIPEFVEDENPVPEPEQQVLPLSLPMPQVDDPLSQPQPQSVLVDEASVTSTFPGNDNDANAKPNDCNSTPTTPISPTSEKCPSASASTSTKQVDVEADSAAKATSVVATHSMPIIDDSNSKPASSKKPTDMNVNIVESSNSEVEESNHGVGVGVAAGACAESSQEVDAEGINYMQLEPHLLPVPATVGEVEVTREKSNQENENTSRHVDDWSSRATNGSDSNAQVSEVDTDAEQNWVDINDNDEDDNAEYETASEPSDDGEDEGVFDLGLDFDELNLDIIEQAAAEGGQNFQLVLNLQNEADLQEMLGLLEPIAADNLNNLTFGFILDGVIDIMNVNTDPNSRRSRWVAVEDDEGHLTYTLKIAID